MCSHDVVELRKRTFKDGTVHYGYQCVACLASSPIDGRTWIAHAEVEKHLMGLGDDAPPWVDRDDGQRDLFSDEPTR